MSKEICTNAIDGAIVWVAKAEKMLNDVIKLKGESFPVGFPNTAYYLPVIYSLTGKKMEVLKDLLDIIKQAKKLLPNRPTDNVWLPYLGNALDAGIATLFSCEIIEACKYIIGPNPVDGIWLGAASDVILRERGIEFVDGTAPGFAAIVGAAPTNEIAVKIARELQEKNLYIFMAGETNGKQFAEQLAEEGIELGWESRLIPFGKDDSAAIFALGFANRVALSFGGIQAGESIKNLMYSKNRIFAFVLAFGEVSAAKYAIAAGAINYGFPVISDTNIPQILPTGVCTYEHVVSNVPYDNIVEKALEVRGCKIKITKVPIPVAYGPAFEGERVRKADMRAQFGGNVTKAFEFVSTVEIDTITDGDIEIVGPTINDIGDGEALDLALWIEVAGRKMQSDFEPILERQIHRFTNAAEGIQHIGQRDIVWIRISKDSYAKGFRLRHLGEIIHAKYLSEYPAIVDKVKVTIFTETAEVEKRLAVARKIYVERNERIRLMTDESVETFFSCLLCQSFAPNHVCIISPQRAGLCGAYNWLDGKAAYEIDETGANQPVKKGKCIDPVRGIWDGIGEYIYTNSHKAIENFSMYSIMDHPMTSCGCFEDICAYVPECNGIMIVNREFQGDTPVGMTFSTLAGNVGGGQQIPGFMGVGKVYIISPKFISAEGGLKRVIWMPKELKETLAGGLKRRADALGIPDLIDKIADETIATDPKEIRAFLEKVGHPAIAMPDMGAMEESDVIRSSSSQESDTSSSTIESNSNSVRQNASLLSTNQGNSTVTATLSQETISQIQATVFAEIMKKHKGAISQPMFNDITNTILSQLLAKGITPNAGTVSTGASSSSQATSAHASDSEIISTEGSSKSGIEKSIALERIDSIQSFSVRKEKCEVPIWEVVLGATKDQGGTRSHTLTIGGESCMPFHLWEGQMPNPPLVAMEVFDVVSEKAPPYMHEIFGDLLKDPAAMAKVCVEKYGADLISIRLEGTHPEKGNRTLEQAVEVVQSVLKAVSVPLIITGHNFYEKNNEVFKAVSEACAGENLLFNWVEQDNYRTIAGTALAYGHTIVAQSPIDTNIAKQLNILLTNMDIKTEKIVIDPMTGALGYGLEYTYSVMERIRLNALNGDQMLAGPMIVAPGQECAKVKESKAPEDAFPTWGDLGKRAALWELSTAVSFLYSGANLFIMYHPEAVKILKNTIKKLMEGQK
jgi:acetyl-CoA synthase